METEWWKNMNLGVMRGKFEKLLGVTEVVEATNDEEEAIEAVVLNVGELGYPNVMISLLDESKRPSVIRAVEAFGVEWEDIKEETIREYPGSDVLSRVLERGVPKFIIDSRKDPECEQGAIKKSGIVSQYVIPLITKDMRIGTMQVHMGKCETKPDLACKMLDALAAHLSLAISRFRALRRLSEANDAIMSNARLAITNEVATAMIHQLSHEVDEFSKKLYSKLKQKHIRDNRIAFDVLKDLSREIGIWKKKLDKPLQYMRGDEKPKVCVVNDIVREALGYWYDTISNKKCSVRCLDDAEKVRVEIHPSRLREVLSCLILNALQAHAHIIEIKIGRSMEQCGARQKEMCAVLRVCDDGDGIAVELASEVFKQGFTTKRKIGTGVGLFIVKRLVDSMSGEVFLESGGKSAGERRTIFKVVIPTE